MSPVLGLLPFVSEAVAAEFKDMGFEVEESAPASLKNLSTSIPPTASKTSVKLRNTR